ncbi:MAG: oligosaccharide flippase family protein [Lachnospiraceae bacterium]
MNRMEIRKKQLIIITKILGFVTMIILANLIGNLGIAYFAAAAESYILLQLLFSSAVPDCAEKLIRSRMAKGQYKNADKVLVASVGYGIVAGILGSLLLFFLSGPVCRILHVPEAALTLKLLAPAFFMNTISAVLQGYFQGIGTAMPTVISGIMKQVFSLSFAALFGYMMQSYGEKAAALLHNSKYSAMYGAAGAALGILLAAFLTMCFLLLVYAGAGRKARAKTKEGMRLTEDGIEVLRLLLLSMLPVAGARALGRASVLVGLSVYQGVQADELTGLTAYGAFYGKYLMLTGIVAALAILLCTGVENTVVLAMKKEEYKNAKNHLIGGIQSIFMFTGFFAMLNFVLAPCLIKLFFGSDDIAASCMRHGFLLMIFVPMGLYFAHILEGIGRKKTMLLDLLGSFGVFVIALMIGMKGTEGNILSLVYAQLCFAIVFCLSNGFFILRITRCNPEWLHVFVFPALASVVTGLCLLLLSKALISLTGEIFAVLICTAIGGICYLILIFVFRCITERDLYVIPGGKFLYKVGTFLHLL